MKLEPLKYKNNWLCPNGKRFLNFCDAENYMQKNNCVKIVFFGEIKTILEHSRKRGYVLFKDRIKVLTVLYFVLRYKGKEYLIKEIEKVL